MVWAWLQALEDVVERPAEAFFPKKMTSLEMLDMSFIIFDVFSQYLELISRLAVRNIQGYR